MKARRFQKYKRHRKARRAKLLLPLFFVLALCTIAYVALGDGIDGAGGNGVPEDKVLKSPESAAHEGSDTLTEILATGRDPQIEAMLEAMTPEEKIGQMFMGCFYNGTPSAKKVEKYHLGGVLLFGPSFKNVTKKTLKRQLRDIDQTCAIAPFIAADEEGGTVVRVSAYRKYRSKPFRSPRQLFARGGMEAVVSDTHEKNRLLLSLGINMNLAPVCDISRDPDDFMYLRSLGKNPQTTAEFAAAVTEACREDGIACSLKHFPGYGNSADTHKGLAIDTRPLKELKQRDLIPFRAGIDRGAPTVLIAHNIVTALDDRRPASLSPSVHRLLRQDMGFDGVIITDDLSMGAITGFSSVEESAVNAVLSGNDLLCTGNYAIQHAAVLQALYDGVITEDRIDASVRRILGLKKKMGLLS